LRHSKRVEEAARRGRSDSSPKRAPSLAVVATAPPSFRAASSRSGDFSLGGDAEAAARRGLGAYFAAEPERAEPITAGAFTKAAAVRETLEEFERRGCDDFLLFPATADPAQVDFLAAAVGAISR
jgi:hypothetical protein